MNDADNDQIHSTERDNRDDGELALPPDLLEAIPEEKRVEFNRKLGEILEVRREESYSGPLQPSTEAERWNALVPGTARRNFDLYEKSQLKRLEMQDRILSITEESAKHEMEMDSR